MHAHAIVEDVSYDRLRAPVTLVFGDDAIRRGRIARLVAERGGRLAGHVALAEAAARLDVQAVAGLVVVDGVEWVCDAALDALLATVADGVAAGRFGVLVMIPAASIEHVGRLVGLSDVELLVAPEDAEIAAALDRLMAPAPAGVAEDGDEAHRRRLATLGEEVGRVARALAAMSVEPDVPRGPAEAADAARELVFLRGQVRLRRLRECFFDRALFADPAWDILLDLRLAALEGRRVSVSSLCIAAAVPPTTGLRWIAVMTQQGLLARVADPDDGRRVFVTLGTEADAAMARFAVAALPTL